MAVARKKKFIPLAFDTPQQDLAKTPEQAASSQDTMDTMFPKIDGKVKIIVNRYNVDKRRADPKTKFRTVKPHLLQRPSPKIILIGTTKLHGIHADLVVNFDDAFRIQSRNQESLTLETDVAGVAKALLPLGSQILELRNRFVQKFQELNPDVQINKQFPVIIAGEWVGPGVQKSLVALNQMQKEALVIISANVNNTWLPDQLSSHIESQGVGIFNISRGGFHTIEPEIDNWEPCEKEMMRLTLEVEKECPFAKTFYGKDGKLISGIGEGIVWKAEGNLGEDPRFWVKTKGPLHAEVDIERLPPALASVSSSTSSSTSISQPQVLAHAAAMFAAATVTEERLLKGFAAIQEKCKVKDMKFDASRTGEFMMWLWKDIESEEGREMIDRGVDGEKAKKEIEMLGKKWFKERIKKIQLEEMLAAGLVLN